MRKTIETMPYFARRRVSRRTAAAILLPVGAVAIAVLMFLTASSPTNPDTGQVSGTIVAALHTERTAWLPPSSQRGRNLTKAEALTDKQALHDKLSRYYTGDALDYWTGVLGTAIDNQTSATNQTAAYSVVALDGGVDNIKVLTLQVSGELATATVQADIWSKVAQVQPDGHLVPATPHNTVIYKLTLTKASGSWKISQETWTFAPGSEP